MSIGIYNCYCTHFHSEYQGPEGFLTGTCEDLAFHPLAHSPQPTTRPSSHIGCSCMCMHCLLRSCVTWPSDAEPVPHPILQSSSCPYVLNPVMCERSLSSHSSRSFSACRIPYRYRVHPLTPLTPLIPVLRASSRLPQGDVWREHRRKVRGGNRVPLCCGAQGVCVWGGGVRSGGTCMAAGAPLIAFPDPGSLNAPPLIA